MSGEVTTKKRKNKGKKKAMLEALQQEEYKDEREHIRLFDDDEDSAYQPPIHPEPDEQSDDLTHLIEDGEESSGSGCCAKLLFLILISVFGVAVGVVFFELGGVNGPLSELPSLPDMPKFDLSSFPELPSLSNLPSFSGIEKMVNDIKAPWFDSEPPAPEPIVDQSLQEETNDEFIEPTPTETDMEPVVEEQAPKEPVVEEPVIHEAAQIVQSPPEEILEVTTEIPETTTEPSVFEEAEVVSEAPIIIDETQEAPTEEASEVLVEEATEAPIETAPMEDIVEELIEVVPEEEVAETPAEVVPEEEVAETPAEVVPEEEVAETPAEVVPEEEVAETPAEVVPEEEVAETPAEVVPEEEVAETPAEVVPEEEVAETPAEAVPEEEVAETLAEVVPTEESAEETVEVILIEEVTETPIEVTSEATTAASVDGVKETSDEKPTTASVEEPTTAPVEELTIAPMKESTTVSIEEPTILPVEEPTILPVEESTIAFVEELTTAPVDEPTTAPVDEPTTAPVDEPTTAPVNEHMSAPVEEVAQSVEETPSENHFESQLEDDVDEVPLESFTMRAEREAVQEAIDNVWVLTVRCIEELRALQTVAKTPQTLQSVDEISSRLEPLRFELDDLVRGTTDNQFESALERAADLERRLRGVLDALDEARILDDLLVAEIERRLDEQAAQQDITESEPTQESPEEIIADDPQAQDAPVDVLSTETAEDDITPQIVDELAVPVYQAPAEPTIIVEVVEQPEASIVEDPLVQSTEAQASPDEVNEEPAIPHEDVVQEQLAAEKPVNNDELQVQDDLLAVEFQRKKDEQAAQQDAVHESHEETVADEPTFETVQVEQVSVEPVPSQEPVPERTSVVQPVVESQVEQEISESVGQPEPATEQSAESPQTPEEPQESQPVEEPVQVAQEAFLVESAEEVAAPSAAENPSVVNNLEETDRLVDQSPGEALKMMEQMLEQAPANPLALYGRARSLDTLAEVERSNARLEQAIFAYRAILDLEDSVDDSLYRRAAMRCIDRMRFRGFHGKAIRIQQRMVARFPDEVGLQNQLAVSFLITNQPEAAKTILEAVLQRWPGSGFAQVHLGFILKTTYHDYEAGARWMRSGIDTRDDGVIDGRFYFHLGDALIRLGRREEAQKVFVEGEQAGVFLSRDQRSLYNVDRLTGKPWWDKESTTYGQFLNLVEANWQTIRDEGVALLDLNPPEGFADESEKLKNTGDWKQFDLFVQGRKNAPNCEKAPKTCALIENYPPALCRRGQVKFSLMHPGTHVWPHTGPTNCRIRAHLGLVVPEGLALRVANETRTWEEATTERT